MKQTSVRLEEAQVDITDELMGRSFNTDDVPRIDSRSEILRKLVDLGIKSLPQSEIELEDGTVSGDALLDLLDDETLLEYRREERKRDKRPLTRGAKIAERFGDLVEDLYSGSADEKATPATIENLAQSYIGELEDHEELSELGEESVERQKRAIRERVSRYRTEFNQAQDAPRELMRPTPDEATIGAEIGRLRSNRERFVADLREKASTERFTNPEDLMKALGYDHGVSVEAIELVLDEITPDGTEGRQALKNGSGVQVPELVVDDGELPEPDEVDVEEVDAISVEERSTDSNGGYTDGSVPAGFSVDGGRIEGLDDREIEELIKNGELSPEELLDGESS